jgi:hypothetical protein
MYPDPLGGRPGPADEMEPAARREFYGPGDRHNAATEPPPISTTLGSGVDKPYIPDPTNDHPLSTHRRDRSDTES